MARRTMNAAEAAVTALYPEGTQVEYLGRDGFTERENYSSYYVDLSFLAPSAEFYIH